MFNFLKRFRKVSLKPKVRYQILVEDRVTKKIKKVSPIVFSGVEALVIAKTYFVEYSRAFQITGIKWAEGQEWIVPLTSGILEMEL